MRGVGAWGECWGASGTVQCALCIVFCAVCSCSTTVGQSWAGLMHWRGHRGRVQLGLCVVLCPVLCHRLGLCTVLCSTLCCAVHQAVHQGYTMHWSRAPVLHQALEPCSGAVLCVGAMPYTGTTHSGCSV